MYRTGRKVFNFYCNFSYTYEYGTSLTFQRGNNLCSKKNLAEFGSADMTFYKKAEFGIFQGLTEMIDDYMYFT